jgi:hypothetical protein
MKARRTRITVERIQPVTNTRKINIIESSVADPGPDLYVFGLPGSGSGSFYHQAKIQTFL